MAGKHRFAEELAEQLLEFALESSTIEAFGSFGLVGLESLALHEQALAGEYRREFMVDCRERLQLAADAEEFADEVLDMGGELDQQRGLIFALGRRLAAGIEMLAQ